MSTWTWLLWTLLLSAGPEPLTLPGFRLHLEVSEGIDPDRLELIARPGVVLWVQTTSNLVKRSVAERLGRAEASYLQVRPPFAEGVRGQFSSPVHPWASEQGLDVAAYRRWAPAGSAIDVVGELTEERLSNLQLLRPQAVHWKPSAAPSAEEWGRAAQLSGLEVRPEVALLPCVRPLKGANHMRLRLPAADVASSAEGCGFALRLEVPAAITEGELRSLLLQWPGAELWARVGSEADARAAAQLVSVLSAAVPTTRVAPDAR